MFGISFVMLCKSTIICAHMRLFHYKLYISLIFHTILQTPTFKHLSFSCFFGLCLFSILVSQLRNSFRIYTHTNTLRHIYRMLYLVVPIKPFCCSLSHLNPIHDEWSNLILEELQEWLCWISSRIGLKVHLLTPNTVSCTRLMVFILTHKSLTLTYLKRFQCLLP